ncbi:MAG: SIS domain-containing protein [Rhizobiales bacterium]|nr:SIS domain-containing protein [Hyphomicrobiales bacterium]
MNLQNPKTINYESSLMLKETLEAPKVVERQLAANAAALSKLVARFKDKPPSSVVTCARGSSDHASVYGKYLMQIFIGIPVMSFAPSIGSIYGKALKYDNALFICISQSGKSPDLLINAEIAKKSGAYIVAFVNDETSPLASLADLVIPLHAGPELSVAATKSYIATLTALAQLVAIWSEDQQLQDGLKALPEQLQLSAELNWDSAAHLLKTADNMYFIARGVGFGIAIETA